MTSASARKLFGTDGIRAVAGKLPRSNHHLRHRLALAHSLRGASAHRGFCWADTRINPDRSHPRRALASGCRVESAGMCHAGCRFLARTHGFPRRVVISALIIHGATTHQALRRRRLKLPDAIELAMEAEILHHAATIQAAPEPAQLPPLEDNPSLQATTSIPHHAVPGLSLPRRSKSSLRIVADCANAPPQPWPRPVSPLSVNFASDFIRSTLPQRRNITTIAARSSASSPRRFQARSAGWASRSMAMPTLHARGAHNNVINATAFLLMWPATSRRGLLTRFSSPPPCPTWALKRPQALRNSHAARARRRPLRA